MGKTGNRKPKRINEVMETELMEDAGSTVGRKEAVTGTSKGKLCRDSIRSGGEGKRGGEGERKQEKEPDKEKKPKEEKIPGSCRNIRLSFQRTVQILSAAIFNGYVAGFAQGKIFTGKAKGLCVPVLNCYSCPGALGACPIGALQTALGAGHHIPFYVLGFMLLFGVVLGRVVCGLLCPFGLVQDLLHKIPLPKYSVPKKIDRPARYLKYFVLLFLVILLPAFLVDDTGVTPPLFCKYICPAGTLEGGLFHMAANAVLRGLAGILFYWKLILLIVVVLASTMIPRPFCRYLCPLGAFYSLFRRFAFFSMHLEETKCIGCKKCEGACPMAVEVTKNINSAECIRCGKCREVCPTGAITYRKK